MRSTAHRLATLLLALGTTLALQAQKMTINGITYKADGNHASVVGIKGNITTANILENVAIAGCRYPVTVISRCQSPSVVEVNIPSSVVAIADMAFAGCKKLVSVSIPSSVKSIGDRAFADCPALREATQPASQVAQLASQVTQSAVDRDIPQSAATNEQTFAVIIGNEKYQQAAEVPFAQNDARIFAAYCQHTLGLPPRNVKVYENATYGTMIGAISDIQRIARAFKGDIHVIFYYAGHGIPDEATGDSYLLPVDADGTNMRVCYPLQQLYQELNDLHAQSVTAFMDACFSGAQRTGGMIVAARGVAIKPKHGQPLGNTVVFTAATDKQTAHPYSEKSHGMFTYYLLQKLHQTKGNCTLGELATYLGDEVAKQAVLTNGKEQTPVVLTSTGLADNWKTRKLK